MPSPPRSATSAHPATRPATALIAAAIAIGVLGGCGNGGQEEPDVTIPAASVAAIGEGLCEARAELAGGDPARSYGAFLRVHTSIHNLIAAALSAGAEDEGEALNDATLAAEDAFGGFGGELDKVLPTLHEAAQDAAEAVGHRRPADCPA